MHENYHGFRPSHCWLGLEISPLRGMSDFARILACRMLVITNGRSKVPSRCCTVLGHGLLAPSHPRPNEQQCKPLNSSDGRDERWNRSAPPRSNITASCIPPALQQKHYVRPSPTGCIPTDRWLSHHWIDWNRYTYLKIMSTECNYAGTVRQLRC